MKARIIHYCSLTREKPMISPVLGLECPVVFEDEKGQRIYWPEPESILNVAGFEDLDIPTTHRGMLDVFHEGYEVDILYREVKGERIITDIRPWNKRTWA